MEEQGELGIAARYFGRAVRENPEEPMFKVHLARALVRDGRGVTRIFPTDRWPQSQSRNSPS